MAINISLTGVSREDKEVYNLITRRGTGKLELEYKDDEVENPNSLTSSQSRDLLRYLHTFVNNITANQARQIVSVLVSAGINIFVKNHVIELRTNNILYGSFILRCPTAEKNSDIVNEKIIYNLFKRAGYDVTDNYKQQQCLNKFDCAACRFVINYLYTIWNISRGKIKEVPVGVPVTTTKACKATRVKHSNMLICECSYKPIYMTAITKFCPYCGGELEINDI